MINDSELKSVMYYFHERMDSFDIESHFRIYYRDAMSDLLLVDKRATIDFIKNLTDEKLLVTVTTTLSGSMIYRFPCQEILKVCKEQIDKYPDSPLRAIYLYDYESAVSKLEDNKLCDKKQRTYLNMTFYNYTERNLKFLLSNGFNVNIEHIYPNGVRVGSVSNHPDISKRMESGMTWFPKTWKAVDLYAAVKYVHKQNKAIFNDLPENSEVSAIFRGVKVVIRKNTREVSRFWEFDVSDVFPDKNQ